MGEHGDSISREVCLSSQDGEVVSVFVSYNHLLLKLNYYYMQEITEILGDDELTKISQAFYKIAWLDDEKVVETPESEAKMQGQEDIEEAEEAEAENGYDEESTDEEKTKTQKQGPTTSQMRSQLLERFTTRCKSVMAQEQSEKSKQNQ
jgi:hypothetical protein